MYKQNTNSHHSDQNQTAICSHRVPTGTGGSRPRTGTHSKTPSFAVQETLLHYFHITTQNFSKKKSFKNKLFNHFSCNQSHISINK